MKRLSLTFTIAAGCLSASAVQAFETHTHAYITYQACNASILGGAGADSQARMVRL